MSTSSNEQPRALVVCAHPDDETLWFASVLARYDADIICVTCGWDEATRERRQQELTKATTMQRGRTLTVLGYPDDPRRRQGARLDVAQLISDLRPWTAERYDRVFTHSPYGEVNNHPHHQDVSYAVHQVFDDVLSVAWNQYPTVVHNLTAAEYDLKLLIMGTVYWQEYAALATTYEITAQERYAHISREASEIFYWGIANFGDHHQYLGSRYPDLWGFTESPYEHERHAAIVDLAASVGPTRILEVGAAEGHLTQELSRIAAVDCTETATVYASRLETAGYRVVPDNTGGPYDLVIAAAVLEYIPDPDAYLASLSSRWVITDTHPGFSTDRIRSALPGMYRLTGRRFVPPRWEAMRHGVDVEQLNVYKIGANVLLWDGAV